MLCLAQQEHIAIQNSLVREKKRLGTKSALESPMPDWRQIPTNPAMIKLNVNPTEQSYEKLLGMGRQSINK